MKKGLLIGFTVLAAIGIGVGIHMYKKDNKLSDSDFDALVSLSKNKGQDIFDISVDRLALVKKKYLDKFNRKSHNEFMSMLSKGESSEKSLTASEKIKVTEFLNKLK